MLEELHVRDLALIEEAWLEFGPGMTVLTGETGAGKTALVSALQLLVGERADSAVVRAGASEAIVEGRFGTADGEIVARRRVSADGRSRCVLDGEMATVGMFAERLGGLVDLHGQHDHQALLRPATHVGYLDRWARDTVAAPAEAYRESLAAYRSARAEYERVRTAIDEAEREADHLRFVADEIGAVDPRPGEADELEARLPALRHGERLRAAAAEAVAAVRSDGGAGDLVARARAALEKVDGLDPSLDALASELRSIEATLDEVGSSLRAYRDAIEHDAQALEEAESRLAALRGLVRKYGPTIDDVLAHYEHAQAALSTAAQGEEAVRRCEADLAAARGELERAAAALIEARSRAIPSFIEALGAAAADLALPGVTFSVATTGLPFEAWTPDGPERIEFQLSPAPGTPARPLARIASGGEISRVMLALKSVLGAADDVPVLVFDEVDAGIGGEAAVAVGRRLAQLAEGRQVIVVTHLAQVAAFADTHLVVSKQVTAEGAVTSVERVTGDRRVAEIARMLSGSDTDASRAHAVELLERARSAAAAGLL